MIHNIPWQANVALVARGLSFDGVDVVNPGPKQRFVAKAVKTNVRVEAMGHTPGDAIDKLVRVVRAN